MRVDLDDITLTLSGHQSQNSSKGCVYKNYLEQISFNRTFYSIISFTKQNTPLKAIVIPVKS